jgi:hypothetical protein
VKRHLSLVLLVLCGLVGAALAGPPARASQAAPPEVLLDFAPKIPLPHGKLPAGAPRAPHAAPRFDGMFRVPAAATHVDIEVGAPVGDDSELTILVNGKPLVNGLRADPDAPAAPVKLHASELSRAGNNQIRLMVEGHGAGLPRVRVSARREHDLDARQAAVIHDAFQQHLGRPARPSEVRAFASSAKAGEASFLAVFLERLKNWWSPAQGLSREEVVNFNFAQVLIRSRIQKRMEHTDRDLLKVLAARAKFVMKYDMNPMAIHNAVTIANICLDL